MSGILALITLLASVAGKLIGGGVGADVAIGNDLLRVAQQALAQHAALTGKTMNQILADLHDLPPLT